MTDTPLNPDALEAASRAIDPEAWEVVDKHRGDPGAERLCASLTSEVTAQVSAYLAVAQPVVNSVEELDALPVGSVIMPLFHKDKSAILKDGNGDWAVSGHPHPYDTKTVFLGLHGKGARVLYRPAVNDA